MCFASSSTERSKDRFYEHSSKLSGYGLGLGLLMKLPLHYVYVYKKMDVIYTLNGNIFLMNSLNHLAWLRIKLCLIWYYTCFSMPSSSIIIPVLDCLVGNNRGMPKAIISKGSPFF